MQLVLLAASITQFISRTGPTTCTPLASLDRAKVSLILERLIICFLFILVFLMVVQNETMEQLNEFAENCDRLVEQMKTSVSDLLKSVLTYKYNL